MSDVRKLQSGAIYTRDEAMLIVEMFENVLDTYNIKVPSPEDDEREPDNEAKLYGSVYSDLLDNVEESLIDLLDRHKKHTVIVTDEFSGTV
jgi:hypothetical protein